MTAIYWDALTVVLPEPVQILAQGGVDLVKPNMSFRIEGNTTISTLSDRGAYAPDGMVQGLFYVPDLTSSDLCVNYSSDFLPRNVTRKADIPNLDQYALVGVAPWLTDHPECARSYMDASQVDPSRGLIFFPTRPDAAIATPVWDTPDWRVNASTWGDWVRGTDYPIWGISSGAGATIVQQMGRYSGNVTDSPFASDLARTYPPQDAVRLLTRVTLASARDTNPVLGRLWVFAIMILAILCVVTGLTSLIMHVNQRIMRRDLRRRIQNGEVDLEILGIKRQKVPQKLLDKMPLYVYTSKIAPPTSPNQEKEPPSSPQSFSSVQRKNLPKRDAPFSQTTCAICLDDFEHNDTIVRELPCQHIFHPECVDEFLRSNSSLCPMCKKSALPTGYCPEKISISMVRRERMMRRYREIGTDSPALSYILPVSMQRFLPAWLLRARPRPRQGAERRMGSGDQPIVTPRTNHQQATTTTTTITPSPPTTTTPFPQPDLEMGSLHHAESQQQQQHQQHPQPPRQQPQPLEELPPEIQALSAEERREWGRQRLAAALPPTAVPAEEEEEEEGGGGGGLPAQRAGRFRRGWKRMFPT